VTGLEVGHVLAYGLRDPGDVGTPHPRPRPPEPGPQAEDVWDSGYRDPVRRVHAGRPYPDENVVIADGWSVYFREAEHPLGRSVPSLDNGLHCAPRSSIAVIEVRRQRCEHRGQNGCRAD
jgi:hypothetical protein